MKEIVVEANKNGKEFRGSYPWTDGDVRLTIAIVEKEDEQVIAHDTQERLQILTDEIEEAVEAFYSVWPGADLIYGCRTKSGKYYTFYDDNRDLDSIILKEGYNDMLKELCGEDGEEYYKAIKTAEVK